MLIFIYRYCRWMKCAKRIVSLIINGKQEINKSYIYIYIYNVIVAVLSIEINDIGTITGVGDTL